MCALEALYKDFIYLSDEAVVDKWSTREGDQFSAVAGGVCGDYENQRIRY